MKMDIFSPRKQHFRSEKFLKSSLSRYPSDLDRCPWSIEALHELQERPRNLDESLNFLFGCVETLVVRLALAELVLWFGTIPMATSDWNKRKRMTHLSVRSVEEITHATSYNMDMTTVGDPFLSVLRQFFNVGKLYHDFGLPCLQRFATHPHLGDVGLGDEHCVALPFLESGSKLFRFFSRSSKAFCKVDFVALPALIQSAFFERALSSSRETRGVEGFVFFGVVFVLIGTECASAFMASLAS